MIMNLDFGLYFITDRNLSRNGILNDVASAIRGGANAIQYREKEYPTEQMIAESYRIANVCRDNGVSYIVNDHLEVALESGADGLHIGAKDVDYETARKYMGNDKIIGVSAYNIEEALEFEKMGANYIGLGPIFKTKTKIDAIDPTGVELLIEAKEKLKIPYVAIGGIKSYNIHEIIRAGCNGVCMISEILNGNDVEEEVRKIINLINGGSNGSS